MKINESNISYRSTIHIRFSGEKNYTIGEITLSVYAGGVNLSVTFMVLDIPLAYNVILERSWIHNMRDVPSTFHQVIKFPTK